MKLKLSIMNSKVNIVINVLIFLIVLVGCTDDTGDLIDDRDAFLGSWNVSESCVKDAYTVNITKDPSNSAQILINNFWNTGNCGNPVYAIVAGNSAYIPTQIFCNNDFEADGSGDLIKEEISWEYEVNDGADLFKCNAAYTRP